MTNSILHKGIEGYSSSRRSKGGFAVQFGLNAYIKRAFERSFGLFAVFLAEFQIFINSVMKILGECLYAVALSISESHP